MKLSTALLFISAVSAANAANIRGATNDRKLDSSDDAPANTTGDQAISSTVEAVLGGAVDNVPLSSFSEQQLVSTEGLTFAVDQTSDDLEGTGIFEASAFDALEVELRVPLEVEYTKSQVVIDGKDYIKDESPDCIPGRMKSALTSELSNLMYQDVVKNERKIWTDKTLTAKAREIKVKEKKVSIGALKKSLQQDIVLQLGEFNQDFSPATSVLCAISDADFAPGISDVTKMVAKKSYIDKQLIAHHTQGDVEDLIHKTDIVQAEEAVLVLTTEEDATAFVQVEAAKVEAAMIEEPSPSMIEPSMIASYPVPTEIEPVLVVSPDQEMIYEGPEMIEGPGNWGGII